MVVACPGLTKVTLHTQVCGPGQTVAVPLGAWHSTHVLSAEPAVVFNVYADVRSGHVEHTGRAAAADAEMKYRARAPLRVTALCAGGTGYRLVGPGLDSVRPSGPLPKTTVLGLDPGQHLAKLILAPDGGLTELTRRARTYT
ncbi:hypothetical protein GCM10009602_48270 [Nocardiopsis tropica]